MKKIFTVIICLILALSFSGCKLKLIDPTPDTKSEAPLTSAETAQPDPTAAGTSLPTSAPTQAPTEKPTEAPTEKPTDVPTPNPTPEPTPVQIDIASDPDFTRFSKFGTSILFPAGYTVNGENETMCSLSAEYNSKFYSLVIVSTAAQEAVITDPEIMRNILNGVFSSKTDNFESSQEMVSVTLDGHDAMMYDIAFDMAGIRNYYKCVLVPLNKQFYAFAIGSLVAKDESGLIEQMVRSIKFDGSVEDPVPSEMETYSQFGVSLSFPKGYTAEGSGDSYTLNATYNGAPVMLVLTKGDASLITDDYEFIRSSLNSGITGSGGTIESMSEITVKTVDGMKAMLYDMVVNLYNIPFYYRMEVVFFSDRVVFIAAGSIDGSGNQVVRDIIDSVKVS
ncbi:MAG: PT domain-containing protein [Clostridia bacterium]|nr:PT domain-containing protein [Clostridia bacterium]